MTITIITHLFIVTVIERKSLNLVRDHERDLDHELDHEQDHDHDQENRSQENRSQENRNRSQDWNQD